jgi:sec-independent protein translocase protein TatA
MNDMPHMGPTELLIVLGIVLLLFGAKKVPELARGLGEGMREFKKGMREATTDADEGHPVS